MKEEIKEGYIRISSISSAFANYGKVPQHVLDRAAARGECVHRLIFDHINDIMIPSDRYEFMGDKLDGYFESFLKFWKRYEGAKILIQEQRLYDDREMLTGEPDLLIETEEGIILIDWKCTSAVGKHWIIQAGGYDNLVIENGYGDIFKSLFVNLDKKGGEPIITEYDVASAYDMFNNAFELYRIFFRDQTCNLENE